MGRLTGDLMFIVVLKNNTALKFKMCYILNIPTYNYFYVEKNALFELSVYGLKKLKQIYCYVNKLKDYILINFSSVLDSMSLASYKNVTSIRILLRFIYCYYKRLRYKFELRGFAYKLKKDFNLFILKLGYSHLVYYPVSLYLKTSSLLKKKRDNSVYCLVGYDSSRLGFNVKSICNLKILNVYSNYGIRSQFQKLYHKKGKVSSF